MGVSVVEVGPFSDPSGFDVAPNEFDVGESICQGDSGGPALDATTGAVIGVVSRGGNGTNPTATDPSSGCVNDPGAPAVNYYSQTLAFASVINQAYSDSGQAPWLEGGPDPRLGAGGATCAQNSDCQSNDCSGTSCTAVGMASATPPHAKGGCSVGPGPGPDGRTSGGLWGLFSLGLWFGLHHSRARRAL